MCVGIQFFMLLLEVRVHTLYSLTQNPENPSTDVSFVAMAAMHSEILLVTAEDRTLYSWSCDGHMTPKPHPLTKDLGLEEERVLLVECSDIRATVVTESGKIATFYDKLLRGR